MYKLCTKKYKRPLALQCGKVQPIGTESYFFLHRSRWRALQLSWAPFTADFTGWGDQQEKNRRVMKKTEHAAGADNQRLVLAATARNLWSPWPLTWLVEETIDLKCDWWSRFVDQLAIDQVAVVDWFEMSGVATYETEQPWVCEQQHMLYSCQAMVILWFDINQIV